MPPKGKYKENLVGKVFGRLTVLLQYSKQQGKWTRTFCTCQCSCIEANIIEVNSAKLKNGHTKSCGCINRERQAENLVGETFGRLTVISQYKKFNIIQNKNETHCKCICSCGNEKDTTYSLLKSGNAKSCGCLVKEWISYLGKQFTGEECSFWKHGAFANNLSFYDTYAPQLMPVEECRRDPENNIILQVKCIHCGQWFSPKPSVTHARVVNINCDSGNGVGLNHFYCSEECKKICPMYRKIKYLKGMEPYKEPREIQKELREMVLQRDDYQCIRCGSLENLECHHIDGILYNPIESADIDNCVILCRECHDKSHSEMGCRRIDLQCR